MDPTEFDYHLPEEAIAQRPPEDRAGARMLVLDRKDGSRRDAMFRDFPEYLRGGDCVALNNSRVFPSRLLGRRAGPAGGGVEVFLLRALNPEADLWQALVRPGRKLPIGGRIEFEQGIAAGIVERGEFGERTLRFEGATDYLDALQSIGHVPLPPYIKRPDTAEDRERYQTVFARESGSVAAPTAGLHFTPEILERCRAAGAELAYVTLHVGLGTFQPVRGDRLHSERFEIKPEDGGRIDGADRVVCVGTTSVRAIESRMMGRVGDTDLFIRPGFEFQKTGALLTNFHLPQSSLLMLVCAFGGKEPVLAAYRHAVEAGYRFYSYGDCMLLV